MQTSFGTGKGIYHHHGCPLVKGNLSINSSVYSRFSCSASTPSLSVSLGRIHGWWTTCNCFKESSCQRKSLFGLTSRMILWIPIWVNTSVSMNYTSKNHNKNFLTTEKNFKLKFIFISWTCHKLWTHFFYILL